ncbi:neuroblast differentiation-associated protein AHNAK [Tachysurus ichikawai]
MRNMQIDTVNTVRMLDSNQRRVWHCILENSDRELEDSHSNPPVKDKRQPPPSDRPPTVPQISQSFCVSTENQDSPERVIQKEKLHAELKEVLRKKRSYLKQSNSNIVSMDHSKGKSESGNYEESHLSEIVEVVVETEAEVGASGYSVVGGGTKGIFIKDVLKDSPAAKHLSLQKGDQLLSARVYFDNVKYEDALKILQCAEPYKVSFSLKRTVAQTEVSGHLGAPIIDHRGTKTKRQKMSVRSVKQFKAKKKRGGRFGLKRLKENKRTRAEAEMDIEESSGRLDFTPVDVEFALPKFKLKKHKKVCEEQYGSLERMQPHDEKTRKIKFPKAKVKSALEGMVKGDIDLEGHAEGHEIKGRKFHMPDIDISLPNEKVKRDIKVEGEAGKGLKFQMPKVDLSLPRMHIPQGRINVEGPAINVGKVDISSVDVKGTVKDKINTECYSGKGGKIKFPNTELSLPKVKSPSLDVSIEGQEISLPKGKGKGCMDLEVKHCKEGTFSLPTVDISLQRMKLPEGKVKVEGPDIKVRKIDMPSTDISLPKGKATGQIDIEELSGKGKMIDEPKLDISLSKVTTTKGDISVEGPEIKGRRIHMPDIDISLPKGKVKGGVNLEVEADQGGKFQMPKIDLSLPKMKLPEGKINIEGPDIKVKKVEIASSDISVPTGKVDMPSFDISIPKGKAKKELDNKGHSETGGKLDLPTADISLPIITPPKVDFSVKGPNIKDRKIHGTDIDYSWPKVDLSLERMKLPEGKTDVKGAEFKVRKADMPAIDISVPKGKVDMPSIDISLPKGKAKGEIETEGHYGTGEKFDLPKVNISLPNITPPKFGLNVEGPDIKGSKIYMPDIDFSLPTVDLSVPGMKLPEGKFNVEGPDINVKKVDMPSIDISLPKGKAKGESEIEGHSGTGVKFDLPKVDISLPNVTPPKVDLNVEVPDIKGRKFHMPDIDFSLPKVDLSLPRMKLPEGKINMEVPDIKVGKTNIPSIDISVPKGKVDIPSIDISLPKGKPTGEIEIEEHSGTGGKFDLPKVDISLPNVSPSKVDLNVEGPDIKGRKFHMPDIDFSMPKVDLSLPRMKLPEGKTNVEGPDIKVGKFDMPSIDISLPKGKAKGETEIDGHSKTGGNFDLPKDDISLPNVKLPKVDFSGPDIKGRKFHMPDIDFSLPKVDISPPRMKLPEGKINVEGQDINIGKADMPSIDISVPKRKVDIPSIDISLPKGKPKGEIKIEGHSGIGGKFDLPKVDISLPNVTPPKVDLNVQGPDIKGKKFHMPDIDFSLPKVDLSLPRMKLPEGKINVEGPDIKVGITEIPSIDISVPKGKVDMPSIDISLPKGKAKGETEIEGHSGIGGKFDLPKFDISLPNVTPPKVDLNVEGPDIKGRKFHMPDIDFSLPKVDISTPRMKLPEGPKVDISTPRMKLPEGKAKREIEIEGHSGIGRKFDLPKVDISLPNVSPPKVDLNVEGPDIKGRKFNMPDIDISLPKGNVKVGVNVEGKTDKGGRFQMPKVDLSLPRMKLPEGKINMEVPDIKVGKTNIPSIDISVPKGKVDIPSIDISLPKGKAKGEIDIEGHSGTGGKFDLPKVDISLPNVSPPKVDLNVEGPDIKGRKFHMPDIDFSLPKVDLSLPRMKIPEGKINMEVPDIKVGKTNIPSIDISVAKGKVDIPSIDISLPKVKPKGEIEIEGHSETGGMFDLPKVDISLPNITPPKVDFSGPEIKGRKFHMPDIDFSLPKVDISPPRMKLPEGKINVEGPEINIGKVDMPSIDISVPKGKVGMPSIDISLPKGKAKGKIETEGHSETRGKFDLPKVDISLSNVTPPKFDLNVEGPDTKGRKFHMPDIDFSLPKVDLSLPRMKLPEGKTNVEGPDIKFGKVDIPSIDISVPKGKVDMPPIDISKPKGMAKGQISIDGQSVNGGKMELPKLDISVTTVMTPKVDISGVGPEIKDGQFHLPDVDLYLPKGNVIGDLEGHSEKGAKFHMPKVDLSIPKLKSPMFSPNIEGPGEISIDQSLPKGSAIGRDDFESDIAMLGKLHMPELELSLPKMKSPHFESKHHAPDINDINLPDASVCGNTSGNLKLPVKLPSVDISAPKVDIDFAIPKQKCSDKEDIELLKGESSRPSSGASFEIPDVTLKMPKISFPKFGGKFKTEDKQVEGLRLSTYMDMDMNKNMPSVEMDEKMKEKRLQLKSEEDVSVSLDIRAEGKEHFKAPILDAKAKVKMPSVEISLPTPYIPEREALLPKSEIDVSEADIQAYEGSLKIPKMPTIDISVPKVDLDFVLPKAKQNAKFKLPDNPTTDISLLKGKEGEIQEMDKARWQKLKFSSNVNADTASSDGLSLPNTAIKVKELDYRTVQDDISDKMNTKPGNMIKIPKFGVVLPSPEVKVNVKSTKGSSLITNPEIQYEGPPIPKVTKAVFVLVNSQTDSYVNVTSKASAETKMCQVTKITEKQSFEKSHLKCKGTNFEEKEDEEEKSDEEVKTAAFRLHKLEFSSPYFTNVGEEEKFEMGMESENKVSMEVKSGTKAKSGKISYPGFKKKSVNGDEESENDCLVSSEARLKMLTEGSESPVPNISLGAVSGKTSDKNEGGFIDDVRNRNEAEQKEEATWFKIPKVTLSPHSTGILQITPERSPKKSRSSLQYSSEDISGGLYRSMPNTEFSSQEVSSQNTFTTKKEGTFTVETKTSKYKVTESASSSSTTYWNQ